MFKRFWDWLFSVDKISLEQYREFQKQKLIYYFFTGLSEEDAKEGILILCEYYLEKYYKDDEERESRLLVSIKERLYNVRG